MRAQVLGFGIVFLLFIALVDLYTFRGVSRLSTHLSPFYGTFVNVLFFLLSAMAVFFILKMIFASGKLDYDSLMSLMKKSMGYIILIYVPKLFFIVFLLIRDLFLLFGWMTEKFTTASGYASGDGFISRGDFILRLGVIAAIIPFFSIAHGIWKGKYNFRINRVKISFRNLPETFNGTRIIQISDLHLGSFENDPSKIKAAIDLINSEKPDFIVFTGDLVNNKASEARAFISELGRLKAKYAKLSVLGNHDYGIHYQWDSKEELDENMRELFRYHKEAGFTLLNNDSMVFGEKDESIALIGVENWGEPPFPQLGDIEKAMQNTGEAKFKILMSHDPSHWDAVVRPESDIDLTLSGHTHGMQFAINIPGWKWSPVKLKYPRWSGLYREGNQYLYVNIGLGFIGFPGRVGTPPEITVFELNTKPDNGDTSGSV